jgi:hypothetical protein
VARIVGLPHRRHAALAADTERREPRQLPVTAVAQAGAQLSPGAHVGGDGAWPPDRQGGHLLVAPCERLALCTPPVQRAQGRAHPHRRPCMPPIRAAHPRRPSAPPIRAAHRSPPIARRPSRAAVARRRDGRHLTGLACSRRFACVAAADVADDVDDDVAADVAADVDDDVAADVAADVAGRRRSARCERGGGARSLTGYHRPALDWCATPRPGTARLDGVRGRVAWRASCLAFCAA